MINFEETAVTAPLADKIRKSREEKEDSHPILDSTLVLAVWIVLLAILAFCICGIFLT